MRLARQGLIPYQTSGPTGLDGQSERMKVEGQGPGSPQEACECTHMCRTAELWSGQCLSSWEPQTTAPGWGSSWENRSCACLGRLRLSGRSQACSVLQLLAAGHLSLDPGDPCSQWDCRSVYAPAPCWSCASRPQLLPRGWGGGLTTLSPGEPVRPHFPLSPPSNQCGRPNGELSQRTPDGVAGVSVAAVCAPGHHRVRRGGGRGVSEAAGTEQAFLLSSQLWQGRALALM